MGGLETAEALTLRWVEVCSDPSLEDLPYKIELNAWGKIEMSPLNYRQALLHGAMAVELGRQLAGGGVLAGCPVLTEIGGKIKAYLAAGAREVWVVEESGAVQYFDANGEMPASGFPVSVSLPPRSGS